MLRKVLDLDVTDAELAVLQVLWDEDATTIRQITDRVYRNGGASAYATVQKLLERLEDKQCVQRDRSAMAARLPRGRQSRCGHWEAFTRRGGKALRRIADAVADELTPNRSDWSRGSAQLRKLLENCAKCKPRRAS